MAEEVKQTELRDYIKENVDLIDYISSFYDVNFKIGNSYSEAICPFPDHSEDTPSFKIKNGTQSYRCHGQCGESGDIFSFVMKMEGVDFPQALEIVADNMGINVVKRLKKLPDRQAKYFDGVLTHNKRYRKNLIDSQEGMEYLTNKRKISEETIKDFYLGLTDKEEYKYTENLRNKIDYSITFPIFLNSPKKEIVANAYKPLNDDQEFKYINDGSNYIKKASGGYDFVKSEMLYGYPQSYKYIKSKKKVYLVEGYFDVIAMHEAGIKNTLGVMCANISDMQAMAIKKLCNHVVLMLDNDSAGYLGKIKAIEKFLEYGFEVEVFESKELKDADDICKKNLFIQKNVEDYIENRTYDAVSYYTNEVILKYESEVIKAQKEAYTKCADIINKLQDNNEKCFYLSKIKKKLDIK